MVLDEEDYELVVKVTRELKEYIQCLERIRWGSYRTRIAGNFRHEKFRQSQGQCIAEKIRQIYFRAARTGRY